MGKDIASGGYRASNGIFYRVVGDGAPLLLLHGLMVSGAMFDPLLLKGCIPHDDKQRK